MSFAGKQRERIIAGATVLLVLALFTLWTARNMFRPGQGVESTRGALAEHPDSALSPRAIAVKTMAATVQIRALDAFGSLRGDGTGFFVSNDGLLATNLHVVRGAHRLVVQTLYGTTYDSVFLVAADGRRDLALLKVNTDSAHALELAPDSDAEVGERVFVTGNPLGQTGTFSDGLVSARRSAEGTTFIQISAPIGPGSSGGPAVNDRAQVLGVTTFRLQRGLNLNYAIPARYLRRLIDSAGKPATFARSLLPALVRPSVVFNDPFAVSAGHSDGMESDVITRQLRRSDSLARERRGKADGEAIRGSLAQDDSLIRALVLKKGSEFVIAGYCDEHCSSLTLTLRSPLGELIDADVDVDDTPKLRFLAPQTGSYSLAIVMSNCDEKSCRFGVRSYLLR